MNLRRKLAAILLIAVGLMLALSLTASAMVWFATGIVWPGDRPMGLPLVLLVLLAALLALVVGLLGHIIPFPKRWRWLLGGLGLAVLIPTPWLIHSIRLEAQGEISGTALNEHGLPVPGASIAIRRIEPPKPPVRYDKYGARIGAAPAPQPFWPRTHASPWTNASGRFYAPGMVPGEYEVFVYSVIGSEAEELGNTRVWVEAEELGEITRVLVEAGKTITVQLTPALPGR